MNTLPEFYTYLSSKESIAEYADNTAASFTNKLARPIVLNGDYSVAVQNVIFNPMFYRLKMFDKHFSIKFKVKYFDDNNVKRHTATFEYFPSVNMQADRADVLIEILNNDMVQFMRRNRIIDPEQNTVINLRPYSSAITFTPIERPPESFYEKHVIRWSFSEKMGKFLGITELTSHQPKGIYRPVLPNRPDFLYIYSDIVEPSFIGSQSTHLMDILPVGDVYKKTNALNMYKKVNKNVIDSVSITIRDEEGNEAAFHHDVNMLIILHFKLEH